MSAAERIQAMLNGPAAEREDLLHAVTAEDENGQTTVADDLRELVEVALAAEADVAAELYDDEGSPTVGITHDTPLSAQHGRKLFAQLSRFLGAALLAEGDGEVMRAGVAEAFSIYEHAVDEAKRVTEILGPDSTAGTELLASAAHGMFRALDAIRRHHLDVPADGLVGQAIQGDPDDDAAAIAALIADGVL